MQKLIYILVLIFSPGVCFAMEELPQPLSHIHAQRNTRLTASTSERDITPRDSDIVVVQLADRSSSDEGSSYSPISRTPTEAFQVDIDEELGEEHAHFDINELLVLAHVSRPSTISEEENNLFTHEVLQEMRLHQPDKHGELVRSVQSIRARADNPMRTLPQLNVDLSDVSDCTTWFARKLLEKYNSRLHDKVLTAQEQQKAAEKTEMRVKVISGVATGVVFVGFILAQVLPSALS